MRDKLISEKGQMTVELCIVFPILIIIAVILVNSLSFASTCASFDRVARNSIRMDATSPRIRSSNDEIQAVVKDTLEQQFSADNETVEVTNSGKSGNLHVFTCTLKWKPTLFGLGLVDNVFGIALPEIVHVSTLTIDPYKPGDLV